MLNYFSKPNNRGKTRMKFIRVNGQQYTGAPREGRLQPAARSTGVANVSPDRPGDRVRWQHRAVPSVGDEFSEMAAGAPGLHVARLLCLTSPSALVGTARASTDAREIGRAERGGSPWRLRLPCLRSSSIPL